MTDGTKPAVSARLRLADHAANRYSQWGEDGIIERIFELIGAESKLCIEFGAWDGFYLSNTANLWTRGWRGVLIEGSSRRYRDLVRNVAEYGCICINAFVTRDDPYRLENILRKAGVTDPVDLLSIDIDGDDYYIFESMETLRPRVVVCEYNPTIPAHIDLHAPYGSYFGASVAALVRLARSKGYELVSLTSTNCFFVLVSEAPKLADYDCDLSGLRSDDSLIYLITSYSGEYLASGPGPYGISFPYRGGLIGSHQLMPMRSGLQRVTWQVWCSAKRTAKRMLGRE